MTLHLRFTALSDVGRVRRDNQDSGYAGPHLLAIADGVGGAARGDIASSAAVDALSRLDVPPGNDALGELAGTLHLAHDRLAELVERQPDLEGTSTTVTAAVFDGTHARIGHVGDSRGYLLRGGELRALTTDHTLVQNLIDEGRITEEEARVHPHRNLILRALDGVREPDPDLFSVELAAGDRLLFCSDGCSGVLTDDAMATMLSAELEDAAHQLVTGALEAGSSDNVTVVIAEVVDGELPDPAAAPLIVGAAATSPHLRAHDATGNLNAADLAALADAGLDTEFDPDFDLEAARYAPRPPQRFAWLRRITILVLVVGVLGYGAKLLYDWSQDQYYVGLDGEEVTIYHGVDVDLPFLSLRSVEEHTGLMLADLPETARPNLEAGKPSENGLTGAEKYVSRLRAQCREQIEQPPAPPKLLAWKRPAWLPAPGALEAARKCGGL